MFEGCLGDKISQKKRPKETSPFLSRWMSHLLLCEMAPARAILCMWRSEDIFSRVNTLFLPCGFWRCDYPGPQAWQQASPPTKSSSSFFLVLKRFYCTFIYTCVHSTCECVCLHPDRPEEGLEPLELEFHVGENHMIWVSRLT